MRRIVTAIALLAVIPPLSAAFAATDAELSARIVGTWGSEASCHNGRLAFAADGTFTLTQAARTEAGHWAIEDKGLFGSTDDGSSRPRMLVEFEGDALVLSNMDQRQVLVPCRDGSTPD